MINSMGQAYAEDNPTKLTLTGAYGIKKQYNALKNPCLKEPSIVNTC